ncbi:SHOCT domain-containing protein [Parageobacillus toebii]|uniref:SHOCT domain-containing protein n=1 Tax=Parageobacillus toebii TaxID=153151 RepID=UPI002E1FAAB0|nr:hypothetical protein [Parageobacillus toebii]
MMIGMMLFWVVLIAIGFYLLHRFINDRKEELSPMEILKVRLAKGEITLDEFEQLSKKITVKSSIFSLYCTQEMRFTILHPLSIYIDERSC